MSSKVLGWVGSFIIAVCTLAVSAPAQTSPKTFENIKIENFGQMDEKFYRGAQPGPDDFRSLAALGVKTIIDLRNDPKSYEKASAEAAGLKYVNIPMSAWRAPRDSDMETFLKVIDDPESGTVFVHCKQGKHRTGVAGAIYRMSKYGWDYSKTLQEMKNYHFTAGLFHSSFQKYVHEFAVKNDLDKPPATVPAKLAH